MILLQKKIQDSHIPSVLIHIWDVTHTLLVGKDWDGEVSSYAAPTVSEPWKYGISRAKIHIKNLCSI